MVLLELGLSQFGELNPKQEPPPFTVSDSLKLSLLKQISGRFQMTLFAPSQHQLLSVEVHLTPVFQWLGVEQDLKDFMVACSLNSCGFFKSNSLKYAYLKTWKAFSVVAPIQTQNTQLELFNATGLVDGGSPKKHVRSRMNLRNSIRGRISKEYFGSLDKWGIASPGNSAKDGDGCRKTDQEYLLWVITGNIQCRRVEPDKLTLQACLEGDSVTLRSLANTDGKHQAGSGAWKLVEYKGEEHAVSNQLPEETGTLTATEACLKTGGKPRKLKDGKAALVPMSYR